MDKIDHKILSELDKNPRLTTSQLGKKCKISQQVADYRVKRFVKNNIISRFSSVVNLSSLGLQQYRIFINFNSNEYTNKEIFSYLQKIPSVYWAARVGGSYDLLVVIFVTHYIQFEEFLSNINHHFPKLIKSYKAGYGVENFIFKHKYLSDDFTAISYGLAEKKVEIDELDHKILTILKDNCRISSLELARKIGSNYKTISYRIKNLEKNNVILDYRLFVKSATFKPFIVLFSFKEYSKTSEKNFLAFLSQTKSVTQMVRMFGEWNLFVHFRIEKYENLQEIIITLRDKFSLIDAYEIIPVFENISINLLPIKK